MPYDPRADPNRQPAQVLRQSEPQILPPLSQAQEAWLSRRRIFSTYFQQLRVGDVPAVTEVDTSSLQRIEHANPQRPWDFDVEQMRDEQLVAILTPNPRFQRYSSDNELHLLMAIQLIANFHLFIDLADITRIFRHWIRSGPSSQADERHYFLDALRSVKLPEEVPERGARQDILARIVGPPGDYSARKMGALLHSNRWSYALFASELKQYVERETLLQSLIGGNEVPSSATMEDYLYNFLRLGKKSQHRSEVREEFAAAYFRAYGTHYRGWASRHLTATWADYLDADHSGRLFHHYVNEQKEKYKAEQKGDNTTARILKRFRRS